MKKYVYIIQVLLLVTACIVTPATSSYSASADDNYIRGYAESLLEREYNVSPDSVTVTDGVIYLRAGELDGVDSGALITALLKIKGVERVEVLDAGQAVPKAVSVDTYRADRQKGESGGLKSYEQADTIFAPLIADPRWPHFSMSYQSYTKGGEFGDVFSASFGETLPFYKGDGPFGGRWQAGVQAAGFINHDLDTASWDLINEDYRGGVALFYRREAWSGLFSIYHNSSHIGDEYLLHNDIDRVNYSYEAAQLKLSYDISMAYRVYAGTDYMFSRDPEDLEPWIIQYGAEFRCLRTYISGLLRPLAGVDIKNRQENNWHSEVLIAAGVKLESEDTLWNKINFMLEYYNGNSPNGQFHENYIEYFALATHFYF